MAAEQGDVRAQHNLGLMYDEGQGVPKDDSEAVKWYRMAAEQGNVDAQANLGAIYFNLDGNERDDKEAKKWLSTAAKQGNAYAQYHLGFMYLRGRQVDKDFVQAHSWFGLSSINGFQLSIEVIDLIEKGMTSHQISEAELLAKSCLATNYAECD